MNSALVLAYLGVALMVGVSGLASAVATARCGMASVGAFVCLDTVAEIQKQIISAGNRD